jgi:hypothetical protein
MKLITEVVEDSLLEFVNESVGDKKSWKIRGPFLQSEDKNRNGRIYPKQLIEREVKRYKKEFVDTHRSLGELDHPPTPSLNLDRVSHLIEDLYMDGNLAIGTAKILDTPMGRIATSLLEAGVKLGVSSRGVGTLKGNRVAEDFNLLHIDIVGDPSAQLAFVDGILENKEFIIKDSEIIESAYGELEMKLNKNSSKAVLGDLRTFLKSITD